MIWTFDYPILTDRLSLRPHTLDDLDDLVVFHGDAEVTRYIPWPVRTLEQTREALQAKLSRVQAADASEWIVLAIEELASGIVIGEVLLKREGDQEAEVGYVIRSDRQGMGLASEAVRVMITAAQVDFGVKRIDAIVETPNVASARLLQRFGFEEVAREDDEGVELIRFRLETQA